MQNRLPFPVSDSLQRHVRSRDANAIDQHVNVAESLADIIEQPRLDVDLNYKYYISDSLTFKAGESSLPTPAIWRSVPSTS